MSELNRRVVLGVDAQTGVVAVACVDGAGVKVYSFERSNRLGRRNDEYASKLTTLMRRAQDLGAVVYLEDIYLDENKKKENPLSFKQLAKVQGEIEHEAYRHRVPVVSVTANEWRASMLGRTVGREGLKDLAAAKALQYVDDIKNEHEADAVCIALHGSRQES